MRNTPRTSPRRRSARLAPARTTAGASSSSSTGARIRVQGGSLGSGASGTSGPRRPTARARASSTPSIGALPGLPPVVGAAHHVVAQALDQRRDGLERRPDQQRGRQPDRGHRRHQRRHAHAGRARPRASTPPAGRGSARTSGPPRSTSPSGAPSSKAATRARSTSVTATGCTACASTTGRAARAAARPAAAPPRTTSSRRRSPRPPAALSVEQSALGQDLLDLQPGGEMGRERLARGRAGAPVPRGRRCAARRPPTPRRARAPRPPGRGRRSPRRPQVVNEVADAFGVAQGALDGVVVGHVALAPGHLVSPGEAVGVGRRRRRGDHVVTGRPGAPGTRRDPTYPVAPSTTTRISAPAPGGAPGCGRSGRPSCATTARMAVVHGRAGQAREGQVDRDRELDAQVGAAPSCLVQVVAALDAGLLVRARRGRARSRSARARRRSSPR